MKFDSKYNLGQEVYLRHGDERGVITSVTFIPGSCFYGITWSDGGSGEHFALEITDDAGDRFQNNES